MSNEAFDVSGTMAGGAFFSLSDAFDFLVTMALFVAGWKVFRVMRGRMECSYSKAAYQRARKDCVPSCVSSPGDAGTGGGVGIASATASVGSCGSNHGAAACGAPAGAAAADGTAHRDGQPPCVSAHARLRQLTQVMGGVGSSFDCDDDACFAEDTTRCPSDASECWGSPSWAEDEESDSATSDELGSSVARGFSAESSQASTIEATAIESDMADALEAAIAGRDADIADSVLAAAMPLCGVAWLPKACRRVAAAGISVTPRRALELMERCGGEGRADLVVDLWLARPCRGGVAAPGPAEAAPEGDELYGVALKACVECGDFESAARAARSVGWQSPPTMEGQQALLALARWLARRHALGPALACYDAFRGARTDAVDLQTHRALLKACVASGDMLRADVLFQELLTSGFPPDLVAFSEMIRGHRAAGRPEEAMSYLELMRRRGIQPDASLHDVVLDGHVWRDVPALLERVLADMEAADVKPSSGTLATVVRLYGQSSRIDRALEVFEELPLRHGFQVDSRAYSAMIEACLRNGRLDLGLQTFDRMAASGCAAKAQLYGSLVIACTKRGDLDDAVRVVEEALGLGRAEDSTPRARLVPKYLENLLRAIRQRGEVARLGAPLVARLRDAGLDVPPSFAAAVLEEDAEASNNSSHAVDG